LEQPKKRCGHGHKFWPETLDAAIANGFLQFSKDGGALPSLPVHMPVKIEKHEDTRFSIHYQQRRSAQPYPMLIYIQAGKETTKAPMAEKGTASKTIRVLVIDRYSGKG